MNCKKAEELLVEYLYQELSAKKTVEIEKHLRGCPHCEKTLESWRAIHRGYQRTVEAPQPSPYMKQRILAVAKEEIGKSAPLGQRMILWLKLATIPITIFAVVTLFQFSWKEEPKIAQQPEIAYETPQKSEPAKQILAERRDVPASPAVKTKQDFRDQDDGRLRTSQLADEERKRAKNESGYEYQEGEMDKLAAMKPDDSVASSPPPPAAPDVGASAPEPVPQQVPSESTSDAPASDTLASKEEQTGQLGMKKSFRTESAQALGKGRNSEDQFQSAQVAFLNKDIKSGIAQANMAVSNDQNKALAPQWYQSAVEFQNRGEYAQAIVQYNLVLSNYGGYSATPDILLRLGDSYTQVGQFAEARKAYEQLAKYSDQRKVAAQRIQDLSRKQKAQEDLKALGYVNQ